jgi:hypothetical protein
MSVMFHVVRTPSNVQSSGTATGDQANNGIMTIEFSLVG